MASENSTGTWIRWVLGIIVGVLLIVNAALGAAVWRNSINISTTESALCFVDKNLAVIEKRLDVIDKRLTEMEKKMDRLLDREGIGSANHGS